jgi:hypothetical protein
MSTKNIDPVVETLTRIREAYTLLCQRAVRVTIVLDELDGCELWLNYQSVRETMLTEGFSWTSHKYPTKADYAKTLDERGLPDALGKVEPVKGFKVLKLRPFSRQSPRLPHELQLEVLYTLGQTVSLKTIYESVVPPFRHGEESLCDFEMLILKKALLRRTLELVNALRDVESTVKHVLSLREMGVQLNVPVAIVGETPNVDPLLYRLLSEVTLGFEPQPASFPTYSSEKVNRLPGVPESVFELTNQDLMAA